MNTTFRKDQPQLRLRLDPDVILSVDETIASGAFRSRSEAINSCLRSYFEATAVSGYDLARQTDKSLNFVLFAFLLLNRDRFASDQAELLWTAAEHLASSGFETPFKYLKSVGIRRASMEAAE